VGAASTFWQSLGCVAAASFELRLLGPEAALAKSQLTSLKVTLSTGSIRPP
jgi:hypothetical protein